MRVERMRGGHLAAVERLEKLCFSMPWSERALEEELENPQAAFFVALEEQTVAGYAGMNFVLDEGYMDNLAVFPEFRGRGIGRSLLGALCGFSGERGLRFLSLEARASNAAAIRLYQKAGFRNMGVRPGFYEKPLEDAVIMTRFFEKERD